jgi:hypothetical protein
MDDIKLTFEKSTWYANGIETRFGTYAAISDVIAEIARLNPGGTVSI